MSKTSRKHKKQLAIAQAIKLLRGERYKVEAPLTFQQRVISNRLQLDWLFSIAAQFDEESKTTSNEQA